MSKNRVFLFFKFGTHKWMKKLTEGVLSFSCTGNFIYQATHTDNDIQGDKLEGVFARLKTDDPRILQMECELGKDLEIIPDNDAFVLLRRKSSKYRPIFCLYSYADQDVLEDCSSPAPGVQSVKHTFDSKMFTGFSDTFEARNVVVPELRFAQVTLAKSETFLMRLKVALNALGLKYKVDYVNYTEFEKETFLYLRQKNTMNFFISLPETKRDLTNGVADYICYLETVGYKLAHYLGFVLADAFLVHVIPGYVSDPYTTIRYKIGLERYLHLDLHEL